VRKKTISALIGTLAGGVNGAIFLYISFRENSQLSYYDPVTGIDWSYTLISFLAAFAPVAIIASIVSYIVLLIVDVIWGHNT
jgi:hypothetical protein